MKRKLSCFLFLFVVLVTFFNVVGCKDQSVIIYTVVFNPNGGELTSNNSQKILSGDNVIVPSDPKREEYIFTGWYTESECINLYDFNNQVSGSFTLYAGWSRIEYTIIFDANGGYFSIGDYYYETYTLSFNVSNGSCVTQPTRPSWGTTAVFSNWYTEPECINLYDFNTPVTSNITLYAGWIPVHSIYFESDGNSSFDYFDHQFVVDGNFLICPDKIPENYGKVFTGWYTEPECTNLYNFNKPVTSSFTLYAGWGEELIYYTITFDANGGTLTSEPTQVVLRYGKTTEPINPTREGYTFTGWYDDTQCTDLIDFDYIVVDHDRTLYAGWTVTTYTVTFNANGGDLTCDTTQPVTIGNKVIHPSNPTRDEYDFTGWYTEPECINLYDFNSPVTRSFTLYAGWSIQENIINASDLQLSATDICIDKGEEIEIIATVKPENATDKTITWASSDSNVVTVNNGIIKAINYGTAEVIVKCGTLKSIIKVNVRIPVSNVLMSSSEINLIIGEQSLITSTVQPDNATNKNITWSSSDETIATVMNGTITGISKGTAIITATAEGVSGSTTVNVIVPITGIQNSETSITCPIGAKYKIKAEILPSNANYKAISWTSSDTSIATVNNGLITAIAEGSVNIISSVEGYQSITTVNVIPREGNISTSSLLLSENSVTIKKGEVYTVIATVNPINVSEQTVVWTSDNENIAKVQYGSITGLNPGTTYVRATIGDIEKTILVNVIENTVPATLIQMNTNLVSINVGKTYQLEATVLPMIASNKTITWSSENNEIATVSNNGLVTAQKVGKTKIKVKNPSGVETYTDVVVLGEGMDLSLPETISDNCEKTFTLSYVKKGNGIYKIIANIDELNIGDNCYCWWTINGSTYNTEEYNNLNNIEIDTSKMTSNYLYINAFAYVYIGNQNYILYGSEKQLVINLE